MIKWQLSPPAPGKVVIGVFHPQVKVIINKNQYLYFYTLFKLYFLFIDIHKLECPKRTQGDGMENVVTDKVADAAEKPIKVRLGEALIYHPTNLKQQNSTPPVTPTGQIVNLIPKAITQIKKDRHILHSLKSKEPKFVPYEPYKAAVNPIVPYEKTKKKKSKNNLDINVMVTQLSHLKTEETKKINQNIPDPITTLSETDAMKRQYELEIQRLKEENSQLENQLKFQAQVTFHRFIFITN